MKSLSKSSEKNHIKAQEAERKMEENCDDENY